MLIGRGVAGESGPAARWACSWDTGRDRGLGRIEALRGGDDAPRAQAWHGWRLLVSGTALSLDDFAVGLALGAVAVPIAVAVLVLESPSALMSIIGLELGAKLGTAAC